MMMALSIWRSSPLHFCCDEQTVALHVLWAASSYQRRSLLSTTSPRDIGFYLGKRLTIPPALATLRSEPYRYSRDHSKSSATSAQTPSSSTVSSAAPFPFHAHSYR